MPPHPDSPDAVRGLGLVLQRGEGESLMIGEAKVTVLRVKGNSVQLGIIAPRDIKISRGEAGT
jgi:carbon storage regulator CsrA